MDKLSHFSGLYIDDQCSEQYRSAAQKLCQHYALAPLTSVPKQGLYLAMTESGLGLLDGETPNQSPVKAEFTSAEMAFRLRQSGAKSELIMRAIGNKQAPWHVIDATPGLGRDAMVMATFGCRVTMLERSPVVAALLADGLTQLASQQAALASQLSLYHGDSIEWLAPQTLAQNSIEAPDVVYLDPMFPHRKKSALVKKEMQLFQRLLGHDPDADSLFLSALSVAKKRVVVKRPNSAQPLNEQIPTMQIKSKKHRFDVYLTGNTGE